MKTFREIQNEKRNGDYEIVSEAIGQSIETVRSKMTGRRPDIDNIVRKAFTILLEHREKHDVMALKKIRRVLKIKI